MKNLTLQDLNLHVQDFVQDFCYWLGLAPEAHRREASSQWARRLLATGIPLR